MYEFGTADRVAIGASAGSEVTLEALPELLGTVSYIRLA